LLPETAWAVLATAEGDARAAASAFPAVALVFQAEEGDTQVAAIAADILAAVGTRTEAVVLPEAGAAATGKSSTPPCVGSRLRRFRTRYICTPTTKSLTPTSKNTT